MKRILFLLAFCLAVSACKSGKPLLPSVSGKSGELVVVANAELWNGTAGEEARRTLACDCPWFVMPEPLFQIIHITPSNFTDLFKVHRNILIFNIAPESDSCSVKIYQDVWARPQCVVRVSAPDKDKAAEIFESSKDMVATTFLQAERDRVVANAKKYSQGDVHRKIEDVFGGSLDIPSGYALRKIDDNFAWVEYTRTSSTQCIFIYKYPVSSDQPLCLEALVASRDSVMKANVPGPRDNSYVVTSTEVMLPGVEFMNYKGHSFAQLRGWWEVEGDFMGGPFVSHSFYSEDGKDIICTEAFLYYPKEKKRLLFHQIESILYSWEWKEDEE